MSYEYVDPFDDSIELPPIVVRSKIVPVKNKRRQRDSTHWILPILILLALAGLVWWWYHRKPPPKKQPPPGKSTSKCPLLDSSSRGPLAKSLVQHGNANANASANVDADTNDGTSTVSEYPVPYQQHIDIVRANEPNTPSQDIRVVAQKILQNAEHPLSLDQKKVLSPENLHKWKLVSEDPLLFSYNDPSQKGANRWQIYYEPTTKSYKLIHLTTKPPFLVRACNPTLDNYPECYVTHPQRMNDEDGWWKYRNTIIPRWPDYEVGQSFQSLDSVWSRHSSLQ
jgi:hypothetical protein